MGSLKVFALLVEVVEVGCDRSGAAWLLHFGAAPLIHSLPRPVDEPNLEGGFYIPRRERRGLRKRHDQPPFGHVLDMIMLMAWCRSLARLRALAVGN